MMKVVLVKSGEVAVVTEISETLSEMQKIVGGPIEVLPIDDALIICNEEGKLKDLPLNRAIKAGFDIADIIVGTFFVCGEREGEFVSLSDNEAAFYKHMFYYPERFTSNKGKLSAEPIGNLQRHFMVPWVLEGVNVDHEMVLWPHLYAKTKTVALEAYKYDKKTNIYESFDFVTTCLPEIKGEAVNTICVNSKEKYGINWNKALKELGLVNEPKGQLVSGYNTYNVYDLDMELLGEICGDEAMELFNEQLETEVEDEADL